MILTTYVPAQASKTNFNTTDEVVLDGDMSIEEGGQPYKPNATDRKENQRKLDEMNKKSEIKPLVNFYYKTLNMQTFQQINGYYCGPATVKQTLHYLKGSSLTQESYASQLGTTTSGTDMTRIPGVLNNNYNGYVYSYIGIGTFYDWLGKVMYSLDGSRPAVIDIKATTGSNWPYTTNGHFLNVSGLEWIDTPKAMVTDPYIKGLGSNWYTAETVYNVNNAHFRQAIIW
jgi:hypothetical protein